MINILKPEVIWIEGRCYRINDVQADVSPFKEYDLYDNEIPIQDDLEEDDSDVEVVAMDDSRYYINFHVSKHYLGAIIGKKGAVRMRIERDTKTDIKIPRQGENKDIVIYGPNPSNVKAARRKINMIVMSSRMRQRPTHFISIPMNQPDIVRNFECFKQEVIRDCKNVDESLFIRASTLHITVGVMRLMDNEERLQASKLLTEAKENIIMPYIRDHSPFLIRMRGLSYMNDDPRETLVLYANVHEHEAPAGTLQELVDALVTHFYKAGFMDREYGRQNVKIHVTLMNSKYRAKILSGDDEGSKKNRITPFDATEILSKFSNYDFGVTELTEIHLSQRKTLGADGFYQATCVLNCK